MQYISKHRLTKAARYFIHHSTIQSILPWNFHGFSLVSRPSMGRMLSLD